MSENQISRYVDDQGRIALPAEVRHRLHIEPGTPVEFLVGSEGQLVLRRHSPISKELADIWTYQISRTLGRCALICDRSTILSVHGVPDGNTYLAYLNAPTGAALDEAMQLGRVVHTVSCSSDLLALQKSTAVRDRIDCPTELAVMPIRIYAEVVGAVAVFTLRTFPDKPALLPSAVLAAWLLGSILAREQMTVK